MELQLVPVVLLEQLEAVVVALEEVDLVQQELEVLELFQ